MAETAFGATKRRYLKHIARLRDGARVHAQQHRSMMQSRWKFQLTFHAEELLIYLGALEPQSLELVKDMYGDGSSMPSHSTSPYRSVSMALG